MRKLSSKLHFGVFLHSNHCEPMAEPNWQCETVCDHYVMGTNDQWRWTSSPGQLHPPEFAAAARLRCERLSPRTRKRGEKENNMCSSGLLSRDLRVIRVPSESHLHLLSVSLESE